MGLTRNGRLRTTQYVPVNKNPQSAWCYGPVKVAGVTGLEPAASAVTGQRSNQLSYTPAALLYTTSQPKHLARVRATDAKEVGVGDPAEETYCHPDTTHFMSRPSLVNMPVLTALAIPFLAR